MRWGIIAALVFCCGFCAADEIDLEAVRETLDAAIDQYFKDVIVVQTCNNEKYKYTLKKYILYNRFN